MDTTQRNVSFQVQFWALLGPLIALITMMVLSVKASPQGFYLSFATISGVLISWKWKERGFLFSCLSILLLYAYQYNDMTPSERLWHLGMSFSLALGFGITALTYQEVDDLVNSSDGEDSLDVLKAALKQEQEVALQAQQEITLKQVQIDSYYQLVETARQEVAKISTQHQKLLKDFLDKQLEWSQLQEQLSRRVPQEDLLLVQNQLNDAQERIHILSEQQALSSNLEGAVAKRDEEITTLKNQIQELEHELARVSEEMSNQIHMEKLENEQNVHDMQNQIQQLETHIMNKDQELTQRQIQIQLLEKQRSEYQTTLQEKETLLATKQLEIKSLLNEIEENGISLTRKHEEIQVLLKEINEKEISLANTQEEIQVLLKELEEKEAGIRVKQSEIETMQKSLEEKTSQTPISFEEYSTGEMRRLEGMLKQLKMQFEEKSATLDAARKELFYTQEKLSGLEKQYEETCVFDVDETTQALQKYIQNILEETEQLEEEVAHLHEVIDAIVLKG